MENTITERMLLAVHAGYVGGWRMGIIMTNHLLPIACSHGFEDEDIPLAEDGLLAVWESCADVEEYARFLDWGEGIQTPDDCPSGLLVYEVSYCPEAYDLDSEDSEWLQDGTFRRPTVDELVPLTRGEAPWGGKVL